MKKLVLILACFSFILTSVVQAQADKTPPMPVLKFGDPLPANAFIELAKLANQAVVNISTKIMPKQRGVPRGMYRDPFFDMLEQMYGMPLNPQMMPQQQMRPQTALGTGFIIREDGLILTNNHVIAGADVIDVQIDEKSEKLYEAKVIGSDERTDIALIKIEAKNLPTLQLGSSKDAQVGEWVAAFGNPFGNGHTMTKGIISAKGRDINEINKFPLIQTDAPINPGNSGGPLMNLKGQVIGVNSAIDARAQGIGFAIPIDEVKALLPQLEKLGKIRKGYLGVALANLDPRAAMALGMKDMEGVMIAQVEKNGPAAKAGVKAYDVITEFNGRKIRDANSFRDAVADASIGESASAKIIREGKNLTLKIPVGEMGSPSQVKEPVKLKKFYGLKAPFDLGLQVADPSAEIIKEFELDKETKKPVVVQIENRSPAALAGLAPGDVILDINRKEVDSPQDVVKQLKKGVNTMRIMREERVLFIMLEAK